MFSKPVPCPRLCATWLATWLASFLRERLATWPAVQPLGQLAGWLCAPPAAWSPLSSFLMSKQLAACLTCGPPVSVSDADRPPRPPGPLSRGPSCPERPPCLSLVLFLLEQAVPS